ncbi:MAG: hypothetical protein LBN95_04795 [Prevotellaceae bacterium]|nr:hypothetical protein [Prevotellaceae bacterium]
MIKTCPKFQVRVEREVLEVEFIVKKILKTIWQFKKKVIPLQPQNFKLKIRLIVLWCSGSTSDFGSASLCSSHSRTTKITDNFTIIGIFL